MSHYHRHRRVRKKIQNRRLRWFIVFVLVSGLIVVDFILYNPFLGRLDLRERLGSSRRSSVILDRDGRVVTTLHPSRIIWVPLTEIPVPLRETIIAVEDNRFFSHRGVDIRGIVRALVENVRQGEKVQGGSTITQQLAKNLFLTPERTLRRKLAEIGYAVRIESQYSKDRILEIYLNDIYFGQGAYGIEAAARTYFGRSIQELSLDQMALLAGLPKGPEYYSPFKHPKRALTRRDTVLAIMENRGLITPALREELSARPLGTLAQPGVPTRGSYFADFVVSMLSQEYGWTERFIRAGGLRIYTTLDLRMQQYAEEMVERVPSGDGGAGPQVAIVAMDPASGQIRAMVGGRSYRRSPLNRATEIRRQPGSAIKPLVFAAALLEGYKPDSRVVDQLVTYEVNGRQWRPQNYDGKYRGEISLTLGLTESVNTVAVQLVDSIGIDKVFNLAQDAGLPLIKSGTHNDRALAPLALGGLTRGVTPLELASVYTIFANQGVRSEPVAYLRVEDGKGRLLRRGKSGQRRVLPDWTANSLTRMMETVLTQGTGVRGYPGRPAAGKTGTTSGNTNAWFVGYTPEILAAVWLGNDDNSPLKAGEQVMGSGTAADLWGGFVQRALAGVPIHGF